MPYLLETRFFLDKDLSLFHSSDIRKNSFKLGKYLNYTIRIHYEKISSIYESHISAFLGSKLIGICEFWFEKIDRFRIPRIKNTVISKEHRGKGIATHMYTTLLNKFKCLMSDSTLNGDESTHGSLGLWKKIISTNTHYLYDIREKTVESYSDWKAFKSPSANRKSIFAILNGAEINNVIHV